MPICRTCGHGATDKALNAIRPSKARKPGSQPPIKLSDNAKAKLYAAKYLQRFKG